MHEWKTCYAGTVGLSAGEFHYTRVVEFLYRQNAGGGVYVVKSVNLVRGPLVGGEKDFTVRLLGHPHE